MRRVLAICAGITSLLLAAGDGVIHFEDIAAKAADLNITATKSFNRGLRAIYYALAALAWLIGAWPLIIAVTLTSAMLFEREFRSTTRKILLRK